MKFGHFKKMLEIAPDTWDDLEIRVCWGLDHPTTELVADDMMKVRVDTNTVDHGAEADGKEARYCFLIFAENPNFNRSK
jgi:hypothetical protein